MIASLRGLTVLTAIAVALLAALLVSAPASRGVVDRTMVPGFDPAAVTQLGFTRSGEPPITIVRDPSTAWHWANPERSSADATTVEATLAALRGAHWHRRAAVSAAGTQRGVLTIVVGTRTLRVGVGAVLPGSGQGWITYDGHALLVDTWVAGALLPMPLALRVRDPGQDAVDALAIGDGTFRLEGTHLVKPVSLWVEEGKVEALTTALAELQFMSFEQIESAATTHKIEIQRTPSDVVALEDQGTCAGGTLTLIKSSYGSGCVPLAAWRRVLAELARFASPTGDLTDLRPLPFAPAKIAFSDGAELVLTGRMHLGTDDADADAVAALLSALANPGTALTSLRRAHEPIRISLVATDADNREVTLDVYADAVVRRGESTAIVPPPEGLAVLGLPSSRLRDPILWREDDTTLSSLTLDRISYTRGAVLGEWTRSPPGPFDDTLVDALAEAAAIVRGRADAAPATIAHTLRIKVTPPVGAPTTHVLEMALPTELGCAARVDGKAVRLDLPLCTAVVALAPASP